MPDQAAERRETDLSADRLTAWMREAADEIEGAHAFLDAEDVPRINPGTDNEFTLAARIAYLTGVR